MGPSAAPTPWPAPTRRGFVEAFLTSAGVLALGRPAHAAGDGPRDVVVFVFLRGGLDGLSLCVPHGDPHYAVLRPNLAVPRAGALDLDGFFSLAPSAAALDPLYRAGELAFVQAVGSPDPTRSHFDAMERMESAFLGAFGGGDATGWLGRTLARTAEARPGAPRAVALTRVLPRSLAGAPRTVALSDASTFTSYGDTSTSARRRAALHRLYRRASGARAEELVVAGGRATLAALEAFAPLDFSPGTAQNGADYPSTTFGRRMREAAVIVRSRVGVDSIQVDDDDWDDHADMGPVSGRLAARIAGLARALAAFRVDVGQDLARVTLVALSEFGRRADENGSGGTDHGRAGLALVLGGHVHGGRVLGHWPGLDAAALDGGALAVTTDYRDLLAEVLADRFGGAAAGVAFPGHVPRPIGVTAPS